MLVWWTSQFNDKDYEYLYLKSKFIQAFGNYLSFKRFLGLDKSDSRKNFLQKGLIISRLKLINLVGIMKSVIFHCN